MIYGVGIDVVDNDRMKRVLQRQPKLLSKILTTQEVADLAISHEDDITDNMTLVQSVAARFAAKEATVKSLHLSLFSVGLQSIQVLREPSGAPTITADLSALSSEQVVPLPENIEFLCSLSHSEQSSVAVVIAQS